MERFGSAATKPAVLDSRQSTDSSRRLCEPAHAHPHRRVHTLKTDGLLATGIEVVRTISG